MEALLANGVLVLDGGLATEIENKGHKLSGDPLWSARCLHSNPSVIRDVHLDFLQAGADVIITSSYQASAAFASALAARLHDNTTVAACVSGFCKELKVSESEAKDLMRLSVRLAREALDTCLRENPCRRNRLPLIAGSVGPFGAYESEDAGEYHGKYVDTLSTEELKDWHRPRIECLLSENVDILSIETIPAQAEAEAVVDLLKEYPDCKAWVTFSCRSTSKTCHGDDFARACAAVARSSQVVAVGVNCSSPLFVEELLRSAKGAVKNKPFVVYPNSGEMYSENSWHDAKIPELADFVPKWIQAGAKAIGGCCRIGPRQITSIKSAVDRHLHSHQT